jgi:hypothetical protein
VGSRGRELFQRKKAELGWFDWYLILFLAEAVEEFKEQTDESPGDEEDDRQQDADEEVDLEHVDEGSARDAEHPANCQARTKITDEIKPVVHPAQANAV